MLQDFWFRRLYVLPARLALLLNLLVLPAFAEAPPEVILGQKNAIWVQSLCFRGYQPATRQPLTEKDTVRFAKTLKEHRIQYAYMFAGPYDQNGNLPDYAFSNAARRSLDVIENIYPELIVMPWVRGVANRQVFPDRLQWTRNAVASAKKLLQTLSLKSIHIDFEMLTELPGHELAQGIESYPANERRFFEVLRDALLDTFISTVIVSTPPQARHWKLKATFEEVQDLARLVDQVAILFYDTSANDQPTFEAAMDHQLRDIRGWKAIREKRQPTQFLIGVGTFVNEPKLRRYRNLDIESIPNTLQTLRKILRTGFSPELVDGIAIYGEWTTDEDEWTQIREFSTGASSEKMGQGR